MVIRNVVSESERYGSYVPCSKIERACVMFSREYAHTAEAFNVILPLVIVGVPVELPPGKMYRVRSTSVGKLSESLGWAWPPKSVR